MADSIDSAVFGQLAPDKWGDLVTLRKFSFFPEFARSDRELDAAEIQLISNWKKNISVLAPRARENDLRAGLHRAGVFEVYVTSGKDKLPAAAQAAAFAAFVANEQQVCLNIVDAMLRFYRSFYGRFPNFFEAVEGDPVFPSDPDATALARILEFDCLTVQPSAVAGLAPLIFSWHPAWDEEHGLKSLVYAGQVLAIGTGEVDEMESRPSDRRFTKVWNRSVMTPAEILAYEDYRDAHPGAEANDE